MKLMGVDVEKCNDGGGISVQGDTTINNWAPSWLLPAVLAVLLLLGLMAAAPFVYDWWMDRYHQTAPPVVASPTEGKDWKLGVIVTDQP